TVKTQIWLSVDVDSDHIPRTQTIALRIGNHQKGRKKQNRCNSPSQQTGQLQRYGISCQQYSSGNGLSLLKLNTGINVKNILLVIYHGRLRVVCMVLMTSAETKPVTELVVQSHLEMGLIITAITVFIVVFSNARFDTTGKS